MHFYIDCITFEVQSAKDIKEGKKKIIYSHINIK